MLAILFAVLPFLRVIALAREPSEFEQEGSFLEDDKRPSLNASSCPDRADYGSRLHVNIFDTALEQFTIPSEVVTLSTGDDDATLPARSDLEFHHNADPFEFWITRRSEPKSRPLFDTRRQSLPPTPIPPLVPGDNRTALDGFPLVFEDQYLQLTSALPRDANIYGLGEVLASSGFRRDMGMNDGPATARTPYTWNIGTTAKPGAESPTTPPSSPVSLIQYRLVGGTLDFYFFSGPSPQKVIEQYGELVGLPTWQPAWGFGFHLCRWGYRDVNDTREQVAKMREANIPLEVMWNDIDLLHALRDFTTDPASFPADQMKEFIAELTANRQHYIPILDAAIPILVNDTDVYDPYSRGHELDVFMKNPDGSEYLGQVWPGYTVFPDWFANKTQAFWAEGLRNWSSTGLNFSGIWLDMNEASSFCIGSCGTGANLTAATIPTMFFPGTPGNEVTEYPEGYNSTIWGPSGNITINGTLTFGNHTAPPPALSKRGLGAAAETGVDINSPPYALHNADGFLSTHTVSTNATHANGVVELDVHNLWGLMEEKATHLGLLELHPGKRPFIISRSTFPSSGRWTGHWLGDNISKWQYMALSIQGMLQFQLFQIPFVGADACGFQGNTDEELCGRWMQLAAFTPFYRNHNVRSALSQEPYRWESVANASRTAIAIRYSLLPYWYTLFANASLHGSPPIRALFFEFPDEPELFDVDRQYLIGRDLLVTPVLTPNISTVDGILPGRGRATWRDWYTHEVIQTTHSAKKTLDAPLGHINVHVRDGAAILLHDRPAYTIEETREGPFALLVSQAADGYAFGTAYLDDGESVPPTPNTTLSISARKGELTIEPAGTFDVAQTLDKITILGAARLAPKGVAVNGKLVKGWTFEPEVERLIISGVHLNLNERIRMSSAAGIAREDVSVQQWHPIASDSFLPYEDNSNISEQNCTVDMFEGHAKAFRPKSTGSQSSVTPNISFWMIGRYQDGPDWRYSPRRLPPLTCLKVPEIYGYTTVAWTVWGVTNELKEEVMDDPDLHLIEMTARTLKRTIWSDERQMKDIVAFLDSGVRDRAREMRADMYRELAGDGWWKKLLWWHDHVWATEETWYRAAVVWTTKCGHPNGENALRDWDFCFTHLANTVQSDDDKDFDYTDYGNKAMIPFAITIPLALLARWTRRPWLIFPVHGLQRTLYWLSLYPDTMQEYQHYDFLRRCKNKHGVVENIRYKGNFDTKISRMVS
ncbi:glycosyl hydrolases family 31-domain-containing protein [Trametes polyzona]|nr:glycosyl hydrolases family 31-domain-containing protein [Trametes polyzona]